MTTLAEPISKVPLTLADLWEALGRVPLDRILLRPAPGEAVESDVLVLLDGAEKRLCELVDGVLVEKPIGQLEARIAVSIIYLVQLFLDKNDLGFLLGADGPFRLKNKQIRLPDVSFYSWRHFPAKQIPQAKVLENAPDLAVEVLSESNTPQEMSRKVGEYFTAGTLMVWMIEPKTRTALVYTSSDHSTAISADGTLDGGRVLPGFSLPLKELFARVGLK